MQVEVIKLPYLVKAYADTKTELTIPIVIPELEEIREFVAKLHAQNKPWRGEFQGWLAYYTPEDRSRKPPNSKQAFYPAEFWMGIDQIWTFTLTWEDGVDQEPFELESKYYKQGK